ncbi:uncharacterized protein LOC116337067 [Contarinia nasturtii]|uniref:uncharacterized protein LOC116337067 n=2 Tax=Contarinia nasturtii TaxID=265458 RepID=UPI0012D48A19|nr:uncharacterized protein LOC116337067 [Contarinia nasturtii]XP_031617226.1 uncharacterized protein LOC116337067 [Contarinia nasturtii]XP_031617227.1 uncharacterized protein LOC116337067 [Contarinia nasturtii]
MSKFVIRGPTRLSGVVMISGAKNATLPILFASLLSNRPVELQNVPNNLDDVRITIKLLSQFGVKIKRCKSLLSIDARDMKQSHVPNKLLKAMRASIWILAPLLIRFGYAELSLPGGCAIGSRPIDMHLSGLEQLGAKIQFENGVIKAIAYDRLTGANISMEKVSVGATITTMIAATLAIGTTVIENAAREPEIGDTALFLNSIGAKISGIGTNRIVIKGVKQMNGGVYRIMPDRIETGTYLVAAAVSSGKIVCRNTKADTLTVVLEKLKEAGAEIEIGNNWISLNMHGKRPNAVDICTEPYPGFPTDLQAPFTLLNVVGYGTGVIQENIFENRFMHAPELIRMGAQIEINNKHLVCKKFTKLYGATVRSTDLRAAATLVLAACIADGETFIESIFHIERGYERIEEKMRKLGADIKRIG